MRSLKEIQQNRVMKYTSLMKVKMMQLIVSNSLSWVQSRSYQNNLMKQLTERLLPAWNKTEAFWNIYLFLASLTYYCVKNGFINNTSGHFITSLQWPFLKFTHKQFQKSLGSKMLLLKKGDEIKFKKLEKIWRSNEPEELLQSKNHSNGNTSKCVVSKKSPEKFGQDVNIL